MKTGFNIFYADDDVDDRDLFQEAVNSVDANIRVTMLKNGQELIDILRNPPPTPGILFLDLNMPAKNGYQVMHDINLDGKHEETPIIIFSTSDDEQSISKTRDLGADMYIVKPEDFIKLKKAIQHVLLIDWDSYKLSEHEYLYRAN